MNLPRLDQDTMEAMVQRCAPLVAGLEETEPRRPVRVFQDEASVVAEVVEDYFEPQTLDGREVAGLKSLVATGQLAPDMPAQLREFSAAVGKVQSDLVTLSKPQSKAPLERAQFIVREIRAVLSFLLEDGQHPEGEEQLDRLREEFEPSGSPSQLAASLEGFSALAMQHEAQVSQMAGFDRALLDEAVQMAVELRQRSAERISGGAERKEGELRALRNRLLTGLSDRIRTARRAVRYLFRDHPDVIRKVSSEYEREKRRRAAQRRNERRHVGAGVTGREAR